MRAAKRLVMADCGSRAVLRQSQTVVWRPFSDSLPNTTVVFPALCRSDFLCFLERLTLVALVNPKVPVSVLTKAASGGCHPDSDQDRKAEHQEDPSVLF